MEFLIVGEKTPFYPFTIYNQLWKWNIDQILICEYILKKNQNPLQYVNSPPVVIANNTSQHVNKVCTENPFISFLLRTCICIFQRLGKLSISYLIKNSDYYFFKLSGIFWYHEKAWENNYFPLHHSCQKDRC